MHEALVQRIEAREDVKEVAPQPRHRERRHPARTIDRELARNLAEGLSLDPLHDDRRRAVDAPVAEEPRHALDAVERPMLLVFTAKRLTASRRALLGGILILGCFDSFTARRPQHGLERERFAQGVPRERDASEPAAARALIVHEERAEPAQVRRPLMVCQRHRRLEFVQAHQAQGLRARLARQVRCAPPRHAAVWFSRLPHQGMLVPTHSTNLS